MSEPYCPGGNLFCSPDTYNPVKPPGSECAACWLKYNEHWDLPGDNRLVRSKFKPGKARHKASMTMRFCAYDRLRHSSDFVADIAKEVAEGFTPDVVGVDLSLRSTGIAVLGRKLEKSELVFGGVVQRKIALTGHVGWPLSKNAGLELRTRRMIEIAKFFGRVYEVVAPESGVPVVIEDHAFSQRGASSKYLAEMHGVLKSQHYLLTGSPILPINISAARSEIWLNGQAKKPDIVAAGVRAGMEWFNTVKNDEVDAWTVAAAYLKTKEEQHD